METVENYLFFARFSHDSSLVQYRCFLTLFYPILGLRFEGKLLLQGRRHFERFEHLGLSPNRLQKKFIIIIIIV